MLDVGLYRLDQQAACQRIGKILDAKTSIRERLVAMKESAVNFADSLLPKTFAPVVA